MKDSTILRISLLAAGVILLVVHALTGENGTLVASGATLIGVAVDVTKEKLEARK